VTESSDLTVGKSGQQLENKVRKAFVENDARFDFGDENLNNQTETISAKSTDHDEIAKQRSELFPLSAGHRQWIIVCVLIKLFRQIGNNVSKKVHIQSKPLNYYLNSIDLTITAETAPLQPVAEIKNCKIFTMARSTFSSYSLIQPSISV
jgi:hypothetical protein